MTDGLRDTHRIDISNILRANKCVERAVLFGSRTKRTYRSESDVDIALFGRELTIADLVQLSAAMDELSIPQKVDLLLFDEIEETSLRENILRYGKEFYKKTDREPEKYRIIPENQRRILISLIREHLPGVEVWAADGRQEVIGNESGYLVLVLRGHGKQPIPDRMLGNFQRALLDSPIPLLIEVQDMAKITGQFRRNIIQNHSVVVERQENQANWKKISIPEPNTAQSE